MVIIKNLSRQDRHSTRNSEELRRRYQFQNIDYTKEEIEKLKMQIVTDDRLSINSTNPIQNRVVTQALNGKANKAELNGKVDKEEGKGLSSNDFTDEEKSKIEANEEAKHTHDNKDLLDSYTQTEANLKNAVDNTHIHSNKEILDTYTLTQEEVLDRTNIINVLEHSFFIVTTENIMTIPITYEHYAEGDIVEVYINGFKRIKELHFSVVENTIVLTEEINVKGTEIEIVIKKYNLN